MTILEIISNPFWFALASTSLLTRLLADYLRLRVHIQGQHVHHFLLGFIFMIGTFLLLAVDQHFWGWISGGICCGLFASEAKELVLQTWDT